MRNLREEWKKFRKDYDNFLYWTHYKKEVPSFELCCKLKELCFPQTVPGLFWFDYREYIPDKKPYVAYEQDMESYKKSIEGHLIDGNRGLAPAKLYKAPTIGELLAELPPNTVIAKGKDRYYVWTDADWVEERVSIAERIEDALAEHYCYIYEWRRNEQKEKI